MVCKNYSRRTIPLLTSCKGSMKTCRAPHGFCTADPFLGYRRIAGNMFLTLTDAALVCTSNSLKFPLLLTNAAWHNMGSSA